MLSKEHRLNSAQFKVAGLRGKSVFSPYFSLRIFKSGLSQSRFAVVVPKKVYSAAVKRNTLKRRANAIIESLLEELPVGFDVIITIKTEAKALTFADLSNNLRTLLNKSLNQ